MNNLIPIVLLVTALAGVTGVEFVGMAMVGGDPCPDLVKAIPLSDAFC
jgi:hypothetical protein